MAELTQNLRELARTVTLKGRYAELPSITAAGMNARPCQPVGRLVLAGGDGFQGFKTGNTPCASRRASPGNGRQERRQRQRRSQADTGSESVGGLQPLNHQPQAKLLRCQSDCCHSKEIDDAGEANVGIATFETWLQQTQVRLEPP